MKPSNNVIFLHKIGYLQKFLCTNCSKASIKTLKQKNMLEILTQHNILSVKLFYS